MLKNYLLITFRSLWKNKLFVITNILGLGIAITCCIIAYLNFEFNKDFNAFHENKDKIFKVNCYRDINGESIKFGIAPAPIGPIMAEEINDVEKQVRYSKTTGSFKFGDDYFPTDIGYADKDFLDVFTFEIVKGDKSTFKNRGYIMISERQAKRFFNDEDPIGKTVLIQHGSGKQENYTIGAVFKNLPLNSSFRFEALTRFENYVTLRDFDDTDWESLIQVTFVTLKDPAKYQSLASQLDKYVALQNQANPDWKIRAYYLEPFMEMAYNMEDTNANYLWEALPSPAVIGPNVMAVLILLIACFNFTNTSIAIAAKRLKEIGIRKVMGGRRYQLILQFMGENLLLCFLALLVGLFLAEFLVPAYSQLWDFLDIKLNYAENYSLLGFLIALLFTTAVFAGAYPALFISKFEPAGILKGSLKLSGTNSFTRFLLTLQFSISLMAIISGVIFTQNAEYQRNLDLGFNKDEVLFTYFDEEKEYHALKKELVQNPKVKSVTGSQNHIAWDWNSQSIAYKDKKQDIDGLYVGFGYLSAMSTKIIEGRDFIENSATDLESSVIVNHQFLQEYGISKPIGTKVTLNDSIPLTIVGVTKDVYLRGFWGELRPTFFRPAKEENFNYLVMQVNAADIPQMSNFLKNTWAKVIPDKPYYNNSLNENIEEAFVVNDNIKLMFICLSIIATLLSVTGLYTMVSLNIIKRLKELGIRKVLGASAFNIAHNINKEFLIILGIASVLGSVAAYFSTEALMASIYQQYMDINSISFVIGIAIMFLIAGSTIGHKVYTAAMENPVDALKDD